MVCQVSLEGEREVVRGGEREDTDQNNKQLCERRGLVARESSRSAEERL